MNNVPLTLLRLDNLYKMGFRPRLILDIGAYQGNWSILVHQFFPQSKAFLIEANDENKIDLAAIPGAIGNAFVLLGEKAKKAVKFYTTNIKYKTGDSIFKEASVYFSKNKYRTLPMTTLDSLVSKNKLKNIDFIKIDTQGSELNIIKGATNTLKKVQFVMLETQTVRYNEGAPFFEDVVLEMKKRGFHLFDVLEHIYNNKTAELTQLDVLFVNNKSKFGNRIRNFK